MLGTCGTRHFPSSACTLNDARENLIAGIHNIPRAPELIATDLIKERALSSEGSSIKLGTRGRDLKIKKPVSGSKSSTSKALFKDVAIPAEEIGRFRSALGLSTHQTSKAMTFIRSWKGRGAVAAGAVGQLRANQMFNSKHSSQLQN